MSDIKTHAAAELTESLPDFLDAVRNPHTLQLGIMDRADRPHYDKFCEGIIGCLNPASALERQLAWTIASDYWRLNRLRNIEDGIFALSHPNPTGESGSASVEKQVAHAQTGAFLSKQSDFKFLSQHEMRVQRMLNRNKAELKQLQTERRRLEKDPPAPLPAQPGPDPVFKANQQSGLIPTNTGTQGDPSAHGFAFSEPAAAAANVRIEAPSLTRTATGRVTVIPFNPASRTGIAPNGFEFSKSASSQTGQSRKRSL